MPTNLQKSSEFTMRIVPNYSGDVRNVHEDSKASVQALNGVSIINIHPSSDSGVTDAMLTLLPAIKAALENAEQGFILAGDLNAILVADEPDEKAGEYEQNRQLFIEFLLHLGLTEEFLQQFGFSNAPYTKTRGRDATYNERQYKLNLAPNKHR
jgi:hypothetical protein